MSYNMNPSIEGQDVDFTYDTNSRTLSYESINGSTVGDHTFHPDSLLGVSYQGRGNYVILEVEPPKTESSASTPDQVPSLKTTIGRELPEAFTKDWEIKRQVVRQREEVAQFQAVPNTHVVISTLAGTGRAPEFFKALVKPFLSALGYKEHRDYVVHTTSSPRTIDILTKNTWLPQANAGVLLRIVLLSGDGGMVDLLNGLHSAYHKPEYQEPIVALVPLGTGNALANSAGLLKDKTYGLSTLARGYPYNLPLMRTEFSAGAKLITNEGKDEQDLPLHMRDGTPIMFGAVVASWGFHATLVADSDTAEYRKHGAERFKMIAKELLHPEDGSQPHAYQAELSLLDSSGDWKKVEREEHAYVLAAMVSHLEATFCISPATKPLANSLRVVHFGPESGDEIMRLMTAAYNGGKHVDDPKVSYEEVEAVKVQLEGAEKDDRWRRVCVDGKIIKLEEDGWFIVRKERSRLVRLEIPPS